MPHRLQKRASPSLSVLQLAQRMVRHQLETLPQASGARLQPRGQGLERARQRVRLIHSRDSPGHHLAAALQVTVGAHGLLQGLAWAIASLSDFHSTFSRGGADADAGALDGPVHAVTYLDND